MIIDKQKTIATVKAEFTSLFPGLKIEFFDQAHGNSEGSSAEHQFPDDLTLDQICQNETGGEITLADGMTVSEVEQAFENKFGLHVQIYRRSNKLWLQTSSTDHWTLAVQNRKGINSQQV